MCRIYYQFSIILLIVSSHVVAIDLADIYMLAKDNDPLYQQAVASTSATRELKSQAHSLLLPSVNIKADAFTNEQINKSDFSPPATEKYFNSHSYSLNLVQPLFSWSRYLELRQTNSIIQQAEAEQISAQQNLIIRVASSYFNVLTAIDNLHLANARKKSLVQQLEQANQQFSAGLIAITDIYEIQASFDAGVAECILRDNLLNDARENLREITGSYTKNIATLSQSIPLQNPQPDNIEQWSNIAKSQNIDVIISQYKTDIMQQEIKKQKTRYWPTVDLVANYGESASGGRFGSNETRAAHIGVELNVPLYQGGLIASKVREVRHRYTETLAKLEYALRSAQKETRQNYLKIISGISRVEALKQAILSSETALVANRTGLQAGTRTTVDVLVAEQVALDKKREYLQAKYGYLLSSLRLKRAAGTLNLHDLEQISQWLID